MNTTTGPAPTPARPSRPGLRGHGATALVPGAGDWLPARTRIKYLWVEDTPDGDRLVYAYVRDTVRYWISLAAFVVLFAGTVVLTALQKAEVIPWWLFLTVILPFAAAGSWTVVWYPETGPGGNYPVDPEGRLLPKAKKPRLKGLTHKRP